MAKRSRAGRLRIHVENDPHHSEVYHITPALFGRRVRRSPGLAGRIAITYGQDPALLDAALAESEVLVVGNIDGTGLADRAPRLRWIQTTTAGVEKLAPTLPDSVVLTNASGGAVVVQSTGERDGKRLNDRQIHLFHLEEGKAVEVWQFVGDGRAVEDFWG